MGELYITYDMRVQGHVFYIEICGTRMKVLTLRDNNDKDVDEKLALIVDQSMLATQYDPEDPKRFFKPYWRRCPLTSEVMHALRVLLAFQEARDEFERTHRW